MEFIEDAPTRAYKNREHIEAATCCGCYCCGRQYHPNEVVEWTDDDDTALCPYCGIDSVVGGEFTLEQLRATHARYFRVVTTDD